MGFIIYVGYNVIYLPIKNHEIPIIVEAYLADNTEYLRVPMHDIYKIVTQTDVQSVPNMHRDKINPWVGKRFFAFTPPNSTLSLMYVPTSYQRIQLEL